MVVRKKWRIVWDKVALEDFKESLTFLGGQSLRAPKLVKKEILLHLAHVKKNPGFLKKID